MGRLRRSIWGIVALATVACGGKTEIGNENPGDGGPGGAQGAGGDSGASGAAGSATGGGGSAGVSGAAGRGGAAGVGGAAGGGAGRGGAAGVNGAAGRGGAAGVSGAAGVGGDPGGTGGVGGVPIGPPEQAIDTICNRLERFGCGYTNCRQSLKQTMDTYELWGCGDEWLEGQTCRLVDPNPCAGTSFCDGAYAKYQRCIDEAEICVRGNTPEGGCVIGCEQGWSAECKPNNGMLLCVCTSGRVNRGTFGVPAACQSEEWQQAVRSACQ
jgi:hypothetical protein